MKLIDNINDLLGDDIKNVLPGLRLRNEEADRKQGRKFRSAALGCSKYTGFSQLNVATNKNRFRFRFFV